MPVADNEKFEEIEKVQEIEKDVKIRVQNVGEDKDDKNK